ncbi:hypothetical protein QAD02_006830 [Eretmocerus hayati]|uniref:Uncharacterized protein n=1 Tax=Eretmocerus hayati TaxID=131215 RepID=A0ACC2N216_9HYME|nr:hypothetical protein QAD02_006830 [Eretmocerus hayati]
MDLGQPPSYMIINAIQGGLIAKPGEYTFSVVLRRSNEYYCSGSIISKKNVVTAASCVIKFDKSNFQYLPMQVIIGTSNYKKQHDLSSFVADVEKFYIPMHFFHKDESVKRIGDIAVLKLHQELDLRSSNRALSKLFLSEMRSYVGEPAYLTGFGWDRVGRRFDVTTHRIIREGESSGKLKAAKTKVLEIQECEAVSNDEINSFKLMCARIKQRSESVPEGACTGDIGGPLVHNGDTLIGILVSYAGQCNEKTKPQLYTKVAAYNDFIQKAAMDMSSPDIYSAKLPI